MKPFRLLKGRLARLPLLSLSTLSIINAAVAAIETAFIQRRDNVDTRGIFYLVTAGRSGVCTSNNFQENSLFIYFFFFFYPLLSEELHSRD